MKLERLRRRGKRLSDASTDNKANGACYDGRPHLEAPEVLSARRESFGLKFWMRLL